MRILVTGGLGFIGSNFIRSILSNYPEFEITNLDKIGIGSNATNLEDMPREARYNFIKGNINNLDLMNDLVKDFDFVVNFAAETHVDRSISNPCSFFENNTTGTLTILEAMRKSKKKVKLIQVSTDEVYGDIDHGSFSEADILRPSSPYSASKAAGDLAILSYYRTYDIDAVICRCTNNFGSYQFPEKLIPKIIIRASLNLKIPIYGNGKNVRDWIYVLDHCKALTSLLKKGKAGEIYNISSGNEYKNIEIVKMILQIMDKDDSLIDYVEDRPGHDTRYSLDSSKLMEKTGWKPNSNFKEAIKETVNWYLKNELWWRPISSEQVLHPSSWKLKW